MGDVKAQYLSPKIMKYFECEEGPMYAHWCPACHSLHFISTDQPLHNGAKWSYDLNHENPTFTPSVNISWGGVKDDEDFSEVERCHYTLVQGRLNYCDDSTHHLSGQTILLPDIPIKQWYYVGINPDRI